MTVLHPDDLERFTWSPGDVEIQHDLATISGQYLDLSWRDAWRTELRGPHGEWVRSLVPAAAPHVLPGFHFGTVGVVSDDMIPDPAVRAAAKAEVQHSLDLQGPFIPKIAGHQVITLSPDPYREDAVGETTDDDTIMIVPSAAEAIGNTHLDMKGRTPRQILRGDQKTGWWVPADRRYSLMDVTVAHEEGHVVADKVSDAAMTSMDLWGPMAKAVGLSPPWTYKDPVSGRERPPTWSDLDWWVTENKDKIKQAVSEYGTTDLAELQAELWGEYTMNARPRPPAKIYGDYITGQLKAAGKL